MRLVVCEKGHLEESGDLQNLRAFEVVRKVRSETAAQKILLPVPETISGLVAGSVQSSRKNTKICIQVSLINVCPLVDTFVSFLVCHCNNCFSENVWKELDCGVLKKSMKLNVLDCVQFISNSGSLIIVLYGGFLIF